MQKRLDHARWLGLLMILAMCLSISVLPALTALDPYQINLDNVLSKPSFQHMLGTDPLGRDVFARLIYGGRLTLGISLAGVSFGAIAGVLWGVVSTGRYTAWLMRFVDAVMVFPSFLVGLTVAGILGPGTLNLVWAVGILTFPAFARVTHQAFLEKAIQDSVTAAIALGAPPAYVALRHVLPAALPAILTIGTIHLSTAVLSVSALSFLGLGPQPPASEWGMMLADGRDFVWSAPHLVLLPGLAITWCVIGINLLWTMPGKAR